MRKLDAIEKDRIHLLLISYQASDQEFYGCCEVRRQVLDLPCTRSKEDTEHRCRRWTR